MDRPLPVPAGFDELPVEEQIDYINALWRLIFRKDHQRVVQKVEQGLADVASGDVVPHANAMQELRHKWVRGGEDR